MHGSIKEDEVTPTSHTLAGGSGETTPKTPPQVAPRTNITGKSESEIPQSTNLLSAADSEDEDNSRENHDYAVVDFSKKLPKKSLSSGSEVDNQSPGMRRADSTESIDTHYAEPWDSDETLKKLFGNKFGNPGTPSTPFTSKDGSDIESSEPDSTTPLISASKKTNRFLQKVKYVMQKKKVIMPFAGLVTACCTMAIALSVQQKGFVGFIGSVNPVTIFGGVLASCLVLGIMWELIQAVRTEEHKITKRDTQKVLDEILDTLPEDKCIKSLILKYSNGNRVYFTFHSLQGQEKNNASVVELIGQPICYKSRVNSLINDRLWLPILGTVLITGSITFPLTLYSTGGLSNIINLYTNPNIYLPVAAISGALLLLTVACAINHWSKTDFKDYLLLRKQDASSEELNGTSIATVKESQKEINSKLLQVVAEPCGHPDITYIIN
ncbi:MAG: hypothetical protein ACR5K9_00245 [Wolbachia sp.]